jgi:hypothetical protein
MLAGYSALRQRRRAVECRHSLEPMSDGTDMLVCLYCTALEAKCGCQSDGTAVNSVDCNLLLCYIYDGGSQLQDINNGVDLTTC